MLKKGSSLKKRLYTLLVLCLVPFVVMILYLLTTLDHFSRRYDAVVDNIAKANTYNLDFKEDMDYIMYIIVVNSERAEELVDIEQPQVMIDEARTVFGELHRTAEADYPRRQLERILKSLTTLENRVEEIEKDARITGSYDKNMERLDVNIRILTELIQEQIQKYIYYEATNLSALREDIRADISRAIQVTSILLIIILAVASGLGHRIVTGITEPIRKLCEVTQAAAKGNFEVRVQEESDDELAMLSSSFNRMVEQIGALVEGIRIEQLNLKAMELKLLQAQINPHFLYNTLDAIIWLAESGEKEQVVHMVSALSDFFRTTLGKGKDYVSLYDEQTHIQSYLQIQKFRYQDILEYEIRIPEELYEYQILKMTLQPVVENALYHGIKNKRRLGHIFVTGEKLGNSLILCVRDDGAGMTPERLKDVRKIIRGEAEDYNSPSGFGLFSVEQRIRLNYGAEYGIELNSVYNEWTEVRITIPAVKK